MLSLDGGGQLLPFVRTFYGQPSTFLWEDETGEVRNIPQGEGGEQGDPLMPLLFCLAQHALEAVSERLEAGEYLFAYLDDLYVVCGPARVGDAHSILQQELFFHAHISIHQGKTQVWNREGLLQAAAMLVTHDAIVWRGDRNLFDEEQGIIILGTPVGKPEYIFHKLTQKSGVIPVVEDLQAAWLLLLFCAAAISNFLLRTVSPLLTHRYAASHGAQLWRCFSSILRVTDATTPGVAKVIASLPLSKGGLGLRSAVRLRFAAHWSSWADCLHMVKARHSMISGTMVRALASADRSPTIQAVLSCERTLRVSGFDAPNWEDLAEGARPHHDESQEEEPNQPRHGWQKVASMHLESKFISDALWPTLSAQERVLMRSQCGPLSSVAFTAFPTSRLTRFDSQPFRVLLLRRLHFPLSLSARACRCGRPLDAFGHHRSACATSGVLGRRGFPLESAAARVCREAGARVRTNVMVRDLDLLPHDRVDNRRLEVVADGLSLHGGAQLAIDTTFVSPLARDGSVKRGCRPHGRSSSGGSQKAERAHLPGAGRGGWQGQACRPRC